MGEVAKAIGDLHYESLTTLLDNLASKIILDAAKDRAAGRKKLANALEMVAGNIYHAHIEMETAWEISKPFMESENKKS